MKPSALLLFLFCSAVLPACQCGEQNSRTTEEEPKKKEAAVRVGWYAPDTTTLEREFGDCLHNESNCFTLYFEYPLFADTGLGPSLNAMVNFFMVGDWRDSVSSITQLAEAYGASFNSKEQIAGGSWQIEKVMTLLHQDSLVISFYLEELENLGGANPKLRGSYLNVDKHESRVLELKDILTQPYKIKLEALANEYYSQAKVANLQKTKSANEAEMSVDISLLEMNFGLGPEGIHFLVEDADEPKGIFEFIIPYTRLHSEGLLNENFI